MRINLRKKVGARHERTRREDCFSDSRVDERRVIKSSTFCLPCKWIIGPQTLHRGWFGLYPLPAFVHIRYECTAVACLAAAGTHTPVPFERLGFRSMVGAWLLRWAVCPVFHYCYYRYYYCCY